MEGTPIATPEGERADAAAPEADIRLEGVTKRFGEAVAVDDLTLSIERGAFYALLGPSGCGKTTTLRMIGGFEDPSEGVVYLGGQAVTDLPPYKRDVNTVFQSYALFPHLNVERNVAFGLERKKVAKAEAKRARRRGAGDGPARPAGQAPSGPALRRPGPARRAGPRAGQPPARAAARRAARRAGPAPAQAAADRAQAHPAGGRDHVRARDPRPGGGHVDGRHDRGHEQGPDRAGRLSGGALRASAHGVRRELPRRLEPRRRQGAGARASRWRPSRPTTGPCRSRARACPRPRATPSASACGRRRSSSSRRRRARRPGATRCAAR